MAMPQVSRSPSLPAAPSSQRYASLVDIYNARYRQEHDADDYPQRDKQPAVSTGSSSSPSRSPRQPKSISATTFAPHRGHPSKSNRNGNGHSKRSSTTTIAKIHAAPSLADLYNERYRQELEQQQASSSSSASLLEHVVTPPLSEHDEDMVAVHRANLPRSSPESITAEEEVMSSASSASSYSSSSASSTPILVPRPISPSPKDYDAISVISIPDSSSDDLPAPATLGEPSSSQQMPSPQKRAHVPDITIATTSSSALIQTYHDPAYEDWPRGGDRLPQRWNLRARKSSESRTNLVLGSVPLLIDLSMLITPALAFRCKNQITPSCFHPTLMRLTCSHNPTTRFHLHREVGQQKIRQTKQIK